MKKMMTMMALMICSTSAFAAGTKCVESELSKKGTALSEATLIKLGESNTSLEACLKKIDLANLSDVKVLKKRRVADGLISVVARIEVQGKNQSGTTLKMNIDQTLKGNRYVCGAPAETLPECTPVP